MLDVDVEGKKESSLFETGTISHINGFAPTMGSLTCERPVKTDGVNLPQIRLASQI